MALEPASGAPPPSAPLRLRSGRQRRPRPWLGQGPVALHRAGAQGDEGAGGVHHARILSRLPQWRLLRLPNLGRLHRTPLSPACIAYNCNSRSYARKLMRVGRHALIEGAGLVGSAATVITISRLQKTVLAPYLPKRTRYFEVSNPVDAEPLGRKADRPLGDIVFVGRVSPEKGANVFAEAARLRRADGRVHRRRPAAGAVGVGLSGGPLPRLEEPGRGRGRRARGPRPRLPLGLVRGPAPHRTRIPGGGDAGDRQRHLRRTGSGGGRRQRSLVRVRQTGLPRRRPHASLQRRGGAPDVDAAYDLFWVDPLTLDRHLDGIEAVYRSSLASARSPSTIRAIHA